MKSFIVMLDVLAFIFFGTIIAAALTSLFIVTSIAYRRRRRTGGKINKFTFPVYDLIDHKYDSMFEDALLNDFADKDYYIYLDFNYDRDRYEEMRGRIFFWSVAAHPDNAVYNGGFHRLNSLLVELKILAKAFMIIGGNNISFIKSHDPHLLGLNGLLLSRLFRVPFVIHLNSDFDMKYRGTGRVASPFFISREIERKFESFVMNRADIVMADRRSYSLSPGFPLKSLKNYRAVGVRVDKVHYSSPSSRHNLRNDSGLEGKKVLLYVGRLHPVKYPEDVIKAFGIVKAKIDNAVLWIAGSGTLKSHLKEMVRRQGLDESVSFLGSQKYRDLIDIYSAADVLLAPHGGVTLVESALASTPIVAYDFDWHSEFLESGRMGYLVPFRDFEDMAGKAIEILENDDLRTTMGEYCRKKALECCSRELSVENERLVYHELLKA